MGFRYRKSVKIGPFRINASKSGIGYSVGVKGLRYTKTATGRERVTASIPGTGMSYVTESKAKKKKRQVQELSPAQLAKQNKIAAVIGKIFGYPAILLGIFTLFIVPIAGIFFIVMGVFLIYLSKQCKEMYKNSSKNIDVKDK